LEVPRAEPEVGVQAAVHPGYAHPGAHFVRNAHECGVADVTGGNCARLQLADDAVKEAIAYCQGDPPAIKEDFEREQRIMEATGMNDPDYKSGGKYCVLSPQERARLGI
jgi:hypothetical protein